MRYKPHGLGNLDGDGACLPTIQVVTCCTEEDLEVPQPDVLIIDPWLMSASWMAELFKLSVSSHTTGRSATSHSRSLAPRTHQDQTLPAFKSIYLEILKVLYVKFGHSGHAADFMTNCLTPSSQWCLDAHWSRFVPYCRRKYLNVSEIRSHHLSKYLMYRYLFDTNLYSSTIISHQTYLASILHWKYCAAFSWLIQSRDKPCLSGMSILS